MGCSRVRGFNLSLRKTSEARMDRIRGLTRTEELGRRVADAFFDVAGVIAKDIRTDVPLVHLVRQLDLPTRIVAGIAESKRWNSR